MTMRIFIVEDSAPFRKLIAQFLRRNGYGVFEAWSVESARRLLPSIKPGLMLLDMNLGDGEGASLLRREVRGEVPAIVISSNGGSDDRVRYLELGAEDYIVKPIDLNELALRVGRIEKLVSAYQSPLADYGAFFIDFSDRRVVYPNGDAANLSRGEYELLRLLADSEGQTLPRSFIGQRVLNRPPTNSNRAVDVLVSKLRRKLDPTGRSSPIWSVRGEGYRFAPRRAPPTAVGAALDAMRLNYGGAGGDAHEG